MLIAGSSIRQEVNVNSDLNFQTHVMRLLAETYRYRDHLKILFL